MTAQTTTADVRTLPTTLSAHLVERDEPAYLLAACLIARQHMILVGAPGTAKSLLCRRVGQAVAGVRYYETLLSQFTRPDEVFGPVKLSSFENDIYERDTARYFPGAHVAFLDEVMRASSAVLNSILGVMADRRYTNGHVVETCPLWTVLGATNDLPTDPRYAALWDRFLVRMIVEPVRSPGQLLGAAEQLRTYRTPAILTLADLEQAQQEASAVPFAPSTLTDYARVLEELRTKGIHVSERRMVQSMAFLRACAWLDGATEVLPSHLSRLDQVLWSLPEHVPHVQTILGSLADPMLSIYAQAQELITRGSEAARNAANLSGADRSTKIQEASNMRKKAKTQLDILAQGNHPKAVQLQGELNSLRDLIEELI